MLYSLNQEKSEFTATNLVPNESDESQSNEGQPNESQSKIFKLPTEEIVEFKGERYKIRHEYQDSGDDLIEVMKKYLLKKLEKLDNNTFLCNNDEVNIFD
jgi:hypothetical protein